MARLADVPVVLRRVGFVAFARRVWNEVCDDHLFIFSAALAYAWLFAIFPFFIFLVNLAPLFLGDDPERRVQDARVFLEAALPNAAVDAFLQGPILEGLRRPRGTVMSVSLLVALWAASNGVSVTMAVMDKCYEIERPRAYYKRRPMAFALTLACTGLVFAVLLLLPAGRLLSEWYRAGREAAGEGPGLGWVAFNVLRVALAAVAALLVLGLFYQFGPCVRHRWRWVTPGAVFCLLVWVALGLGFKYYATHWGRYGQTFGNLGGVAVLLVLFYIDAFVMLMGAEINSEIDFEVLGVRRGSTNFRAKEALCDGAALGEASTPRVALPPAPQPAPTPGAERSDAPDPLA